MKKILLVLVMVLLPMVAVANPFVVSDPYVPTDIQPTNFYVTMDAGNPVSVPPWQATGGLILKYDIGTVSIGAHTVKVKACVTDVNWGEACSADAVFTFTKPAAPLSPKNIMLMK